MLTKKPTVVKDDRKYIATFRVKKSGLLIYWRYKTPEGAKKSAKETADQWELVSIEEIK